MTETVNIDSRGVVVRELNARVVADERGRPRVEPLSGEAGRWRTVLERYVDKGPVRLAVWRVTGRRSHAQNRLLWRVYQEGLDGLRELALESGERCPFRDKEDVHEAMLYRFLGMTVTRFLGHEIEHPPSSRVLTVEQFSTYLRQVVQQFALWGVYVEMPGEAA